MKMITVSEAEEAWKWLVGMLWDSFDANFPVEIEVKRQEADGEQDQGFFFIQRESSKESTRIVLLVGKDESIEAQCHTLFGAFFHVISKWAKFSIDPPCPTQDSRYLGVSVLSQIIATAFAWTYLYRDLTSRPLSS